MRIVIAGGTGFLGAALTAALRADGHDVVVLTRQSGALPPGLASWTPDGTAGAWARVARRRRCGDQPRRRAARREAVDRVAEARAGREPRPGDPQPRGAIAAAVRPPAVFLSSSAVGYYGARGDEESPRADAAGSDFLARLVVAVGGRSTAAASSRHARRAAAKRHRARTGRRRAGAHAAAVPARRRRTVRQRPPVHVVDSPAGLDRPRAMAAHHAPTRVARST